MKSEESRTFWEDIWGKNININTLDGCCMQLEADLANLDKQIDVQVTKNAKLKITSTRQVAMILFEKVYVSDRKHRKSTELVFDNKGQRLGQTNHLPTCNVEVAHWTTR